MTTMNETFTQVDYLFRSTDRTNRCTTRILLIYEFVPALLTEIMLTGELDLSTFDKKAPTLYKSLSKFLPRLLIDARYRRPGNIHLLCRLLVSQSFIIYQAKHLILLQIHRHGLSIITPHP
jgi:hypothetical protein